MSFGDTEMAHWVTNLLHSLTISVQYPEHIQIWKERNDFPKLSPNFFYTCTIAHVQTCMHNCPPPPCFKIKKRKNNYCQTSQLGIT